MFLKKGCCLRDSQGSCVGLYMINRAEWVISELACVAYSFVSVPLYDTLGKLPPLLIYVPLLRALVMLFIMHLVVDWLKN